MATQPKIRESESETIVPFRPYNMLQEMERLFEQFMPTGWSRPAGLERSLLADISPKIDVIDQDDTILVKAALPGVQKDDLEVSTTDHSVTIRGSMRKESKEEKKGEYYRREISTGNFLRTVALPSSIDEKGIKAKFRDGMLELTMPKLEREKRHNIRIETD